MLSRLLEMEESEATEEADEGGVGSASSTTTAFSCRLPFKIFTKKAICSSFIATAIFVMRTFTSSGLLTTAVIARSMPPSSARSLVPAAVTKCVVAFMLLTATDSVFSDAGSALSVFWRVRRPISKEATSVDCEAVGTDTRMLCSTKSTWGMRSSQPGSSPFPTASADSFRLLTMDANSDSSSSSSSSSAMVSSGVWSESTERSDPAAVFSASNSFSPSASGPASR